MTCRHPKSADIWTLDEIRTAIGFRAADLVPVNPEYVRLAGNIRPVYLSRLKCLEHYAHITPESVDNMKSTVTAQAPAAPAPTTQQVIEDILARAYEGKPVDAAELAKARAAVELEELAAKGASDRAEAAAAQAAREALEALYAPCQEHLAESRANVQDALDAAYQALMNLLDAVEDHSADHDEVLQTLMDAGQDPSTIRSSDNSYAMTLTVGAEQFKLHRKAEYLLSLLHALKAARPHGDLLSAGGRSITADLPAPAQGGPRVSAEMVNP